MGGSLTFLARAIFLLEDTTKKMDPLFVRHQYTSCVTILHVPLAESSWKVALESLLFNIVCKYIITQCQ